jgi:hypothetical protein
LLKISHIINRRTSTDLFTGTKLDIGEFVKKSVDGIVGANDGSDNWEMPHRLGRDFSQLMGATSSSAQDKRVR